MHTQTHMYIHTHVYIHSLSGAFIFQTFYFIFFSSACYSLGRRFGHSESGLSCLSYCCVLGENFGFCWNSCVILIFIVYKKQLMTVAILSA